MAILCIVLTVLYQLSVSFPVPETLFSIDVYIWDSVGCICGRPRQTWLRTVENDFKQQNLGLWSARHRAYDREKWREIVETATLL